LLVSSADALVSSSSEAEQKSEEELDESDSNSEPELEEPSIEMVDADDDLSAVVEEAMDDSADEVTAGDADSITVEPTLVDVAVPLLRRWWKADDSHLAATIPEFAFLSKVEVIRGVIVLSLSTLLLQIWNMLFGLATSASGIRENTVNWWNYFFVSGNDSSIAPEFSDPLGWALLIATFCILLSTMPRRPKD